MKTSLVFDKIQKEIPRVVETLFSLIPSGVGAEGAIPKLSKGDEKRLLKGGARWAVEQGYGRELDLVGQGLREPALVGDIGVKAISAGR